VGRVEFNLGRCTKLLDEPLKPERSGARTKSNFAYGESSVSCAFSFDEGCFIGATPSLRIMSSNSS